VAGLVVVKRKSRPCGWIRTERARRIVQIGREAGEIGDQAERRLHIARSIRQFLGSALVFVATDDDVHAGAAGHVVASAVDNFDVRARPVFESMCERGSTFNPAIMGMQAAVLARDIGHATVLSLDQLIEERAWRRSFFYQHFMRPAGIDHGLYSAIRVNDSICDVLGCWRERKDRPFDEEHRAEIELLVGEFGHLWRRQTRAEPWPGQLPPRYRRTFELLLTGLSEKQIAAELELTPGSLHQYVTSLYKMLGVSSRAELMSRAIKRSDLSLDNIRRADER
jgi:DNA-binding CsgD family transcriptional regulator